jgi:hypothetical protein
MMGLQYEPCSTIFSDQRGEDKKATARELLFVWIDWLCVLCPGKPRGPGNRVRHHTADLSGRVLKDAGLYPIYLLDDLR